MSKPAVSARIIKLVMGLILMLSGLVTTALLFVPYRHALETRSWTETPCVITGSRMEEYRISDFAEPVARVFIKYGYTFDGKEYTGTRVKRVTFSANDDKDVSLRTSKFEDAAKVVAKYPPDTRTVCFVNPVVPSEAVLEHQTKAAIYTLWWPMLFAVGGGGIVWSAFRKVRPRAA